MKAHRSRTMRLVILVYQLGLILRTEAQSGCNSHSTYRPPENSDITVDCGTKYMDMSIYLCPVYFANYNESLMALNGEYSSLSCLGTADWNADPPVLKFKFPISESGVAICGNTLRIYDTTGTGIFSDFSSIQHVNISGIISAYDPSAGTITYRQHLLYMFSCSYPMLYLVNNTELGVSGVNLAVKDNNGSFISTLRMRLFSDPGYSVPLNLPESGLNLKTKIYVGIHAENLTDRFNVLLDRCYASTSPLPSNGTFYDLFVGCNRDGQTKVDLNGQAQNAHFSFEAFRFVEHKNMSISTFYLHCITRLCEVDKCASLLPDCESSPSRRKRDVKALDAEPESDNTAILNSPPINVNNDANPGSGLPSVFSESHNQTFGDDEYYYSTRKEGSPHTVSQLPGSKPNNSTLVGVTVSVAVLAVIFVSFIALLGLYLHRKRKNKA